LPICEAVNDVLSGGIDLDTAIEALLNRPFRAEAP
jgi:hypothetical protein